MKFSATHLAFESWPDPYDAFSLDWESIPERYRAGDDPDEILTLYRATTADQSQFGMLSNAFRIFGFDASKQAQALVHQPSAELAGQIDRFTSSSELSPFLPAAWDEEQTKSWASKNRAVYELRIPARRVIVDGDNTGNLQEAMILGAVLPQEIVSGPSGDPSYPDAWRELATAWKVQHYLANNPSHRVGLRVTTHGQLEGVEILAAEKFVSGQKKAQLQKRLDRLSPEAFVAAARTQKKSKQSLIKVGSGDDALTLLFQRHQRGFLARTDADAIYTFSIVPPEALNVA